SSGGNESFTMNVATMAGIDRLARTHGATPFMAMLAAFAVWLGELTDRRDFVVGTAVAGRGFREVEGAIGYFINMVPIRVVLQDEPFATCLARVRDTVLGALSHQNVPFETVLERLRPQRNPHNTPLIQVAFGVENGPQPRAEAAGRTFEG